MRPTTALFEGLSLVSSTLFFLLLALGTSKGKPCCEWDC